MNFYARCEEALLSSDVDTKSDIIDELIGYCNTNEVALPNIFPNPEIEIHDSILSSHPWTSHKIIAEPSGATQILSKAHEYEHSTDSKNPISGFGDFEPQVFDEPSFSSICRIVAPRELPSRKDFHTAQGLATLVHSIAHIEFSAIDLALDAVYRFTDMPIEYKRDWLIVAQDEVRHYRMLRGLLNQLGFEYGDFPVHKGLFEMSMKTADDVLDRMAVIPRHFEAGGLDVNPQIAKKLDRYRNDPIVEEIIDALKVIEDEEIDHVRKGDRWFRYICQERGLNVSETFVSILNRYNLLARHRPHMNIPARKEAGFSCDELLELGAESCE